MKDLKLFLEGKTIDEVTVKDIKTNKKVDVIVSCDNYNGKVKSNLKKY